MSKAVTATISISTDTRVAGRYFVDVRDVTAGRNRQMTTRVTDTPAVFLAELADAAAAADVALTVIDETGGEVADTAAAAESAAAIAAAPAVTRVADLAETTRPVCSNAFPAADDLDGKKFPELMAIAKLHNVPGRGTARKPQLIAGIRAARGEADAAFRRALSAPGRVVTPQPVTAPAVLPGRAAAALVWSGRRELSGRYAIETIRRGSSTLYRGVVAAGRAPIGHWHPRLRDAKDAVQQRHEDIARAHNTAALMESARVAGDEGWAALDAQHIDAVAENDRRAAARTRAPRELSPLGALAAAYRETHPAVR